MILNAENAKQIENLIPIYLEEVAKPTYDEKYKWDAVIHFKKTYNTDVDNFSEMLKDSFSGAGASSLWSLLPETRELITCEIDWFLRVVLLAAIFLFCFFF